MIGVVEIPAEQEPRAPGAQVPRGGTILRQKARGARNDVRHGELEWPDVSPEYSNFLSRVKRHVTHMNHRDGCKATILASKL